MPRRSSLAVAAATLVGSVTAVLAPASPVAAAGPYTMSVASPVPGRIGVDAIYAGGGGGAYDIQTCSWDPNVPTLGWNANGGLEGTTTVPSTLYGPLTKVRFELYPGGTSRTDCSYDPWTSSVGGVHVEVPAGTTDLGSVALPVDGRPGQFRIDGRILSSSKLTDGRVTVDTFQIPTVFPDQPAPLQTNGKVTYGTFASTKSRGDRWTAGVGFSGRYILFVTDTVAGRAVTATVDIAAGSIPTIDLDAVCFGFDTCTYGQGGPTTATGTFHPTAPTRVLDTRIGLGITNGPVRTGDGRNGDPNPLVRRDETANHDLQVTGRFGIPSSGVSAVLLNVTAVHAPGVGYLSVVPKPPAAGDIFNDQSTYGALPTTSNLNVGSDQAVPNLVLARVGAGGKIRLSNSWGPTHVIADVAGWFGTGGAHVDGAGFAGVVPARLLDSRLGIGGPRARFRAGEQRSLQVAGVAGVPRNAESVVVNITAVGPSANGYVTAFPDGTGAPNASNLNFLPGGVRANTAVVKVGEGGRIRLRAAEADTDLIVDVLGSFGPYGGRVTTITPERVVDTRDGTGTERRPLGQLETRTLQIAGRGSVPAGATAVIANLTATNTTSVGYLTGFPTGATRPRSSNVNFLPGQSIPNLVMLKLGDGGSISVFNELGSSDVIVDVMGYVS